MPGGTQLIHNWRCCKTVFEQGIYRADQLAGVSSIFGSTTNENVWVSGCISPRFLNGDNR
jgi:hypothetical protein